MFWFWEDREGIRLGPAFFLSEGAMMRKVSREIFVSMNCAVPLGMCSSDTTEADLLK